MKKIELIQQLLRNKGVIVTHRLEHRLYFDGQLYIRSIGYNFVSVYEDGFSHNFDLSLGSLSDKVLDLIINELNK